MAEKNKAKKTEDKEPAQKNKTRSTADKEPKEQVDLEKAFEELQEIIAKLESDSIPLRESIELYGKGAGIVDKCRKELEGIEKEMVVIGENYEL